MEFRILGPLEVAWEGRAVSLGRGVERTVLAILLVHANEVVSVDRLADELWGERAPEGARKAIQVYVSRLRKALEQGSPETGAQERIQTRGPGYVLVVDDGELDSLRFARLCDRASSELSDGDPRLASQTWREALAVWRGPALADVAFEPFAQGEIARLEDLRLAALEDRIDADLACGRHRELVGELEALVAQHPLRERLQGQLMLALYRSDRQAEALEGYRRARSSLVEELGIEPGEPLRALHQAILRHDPELMPPPRAQSALVAPVEPDDDAIKPMRLRSAPALAGGLVLLILALAGLAVTQRSSSAAHGQVNSVALISPESDRVVASVPVGVGPANLVAGEHSVWVANLQDGTVSRIDAATHRVIATIAAGASVTGLAAGGGSVWVSTLNGSLRRVDPTFDAITQTLSMHDYPSSYGFQIDNSLNQSSPVAVAEGSVWFGHDTTVSQVNAATGRRLRLFGAGLSPSGIAIGSGATWVSDRVDDTVTRIAADGTTSDVTVGHAPGALAVGAGRVWVADAQDNAVVEIYPATESVLRTIAVGSQPSGIAVGAGSVWVANAGDGTVSRIDPRRGVAVATIKVNGSPSGVVVADGRVWVSVQERPPTATIARSGGTARVQASSDFDSIDPAIASDKAAFQLEYSTCAKLLNYPDAPGSGGATLVPDAAAAMPTVSNGGRTYTFTIRPGFRFSPPSNRPVTAETFRYTIERDLSRGMGSPEAAYLSDVVGAGAYEAGRARRLAGVTVRGRRLIVRLTAPAPDLSARLAYPAFCAVPVGTPFRPQTAQPIPSAGPYYIATYVPRRALVLRRNPNYSGSRPRRLAQIDYTFGINPATTVREIERGRVDYAASSSITGALPPAELPQLIARYGPRSKAAAGGHQQYFENPSLGDIWIALNPNRAAFANVNVRRAVAYALDRPAISRETGYAFRPDDHLIPPALPAYQPTLTYPLDGPNLAMARRLMAGRHLTAILLDCEGCDNQLIAIDLAKIGITVIDQKLPVAQFLTRSKTPGAAVDIYLGGTGNVYADPIEFLNHVLIGRFIAAVAPHVPAVTRQLAQAASLSGLARQRAYQQLDAEVTHDAYLVPLGDTTEQDFFSARIGCQLYQPIYGMDLGALCIRQHH